MDVGLSSEQMVEGRNSSKDHKRLSPSNHHQQMASKPNQVGTVLLYGVPIVSLVIENQERLCLAQISNTLLKEFSYNEIHNRRVALGITCVQCTPVQLEILRRAGAMPVSSRRCGMITRREAERLCKSFLGDNAPPRLPDDFAFSVHHECAWGCRGAFLPSRYNSSRAKCIKCSYCGLFFSPNKFIFHSHRTGPAAKYVQPDAANFNSWRRHMKLSGSAPEEVTHAWEDVKAMFNGGTRKRLLASTSISHHSSRPSPSMMVTTSAKQQKLSQEPVSPTPGGSSIVPTAVLPAPPPRVPPFPDLPLPLSRSIVMDYVWQHSANNMKHHQFPFPPWPWLAGGKRVAPFLGFGQDGPLPLHGHPTVGPLHPAPLDGKLYPSAFRPVYPAVPRPEPEPDSQPEFEMEASDEETVDIETTEEDGPAGGDSSVVNPSTTPGTGPESTASCWEDGKSQERIVEDQMGEEDNEQNDESPDKTSEEGAQRLWTVARLSLERPERVLYRQEMARHLHIMRGLGMPPGTEPSSYFSLSETLHQDAERRHGRLKEPHSVLQHLSSKMALDCSACHQLYNMQQSDSKISQ